MSQSVHRAVDVLELLARGPRTQAEIGAHLGVHRSSALRLLAPLAEGGLVRRLPDGRYGIGHRLAGLAEAAREQFPLREVAAPHLRALGTRCGHTVHLVAPEEGRIVYADKAEPHATVRLYAQIGRPVTLHTAAAAKALLAFLEPAEAERLLDGHEFTLHTASTPASRAALDARLAEVRERGWATDDGEFEDFVNCLAAPVRDASGRAAAAVSVTALKARADLAALRGAVLDDLLTTTDTISRELGWRP